MTHPLLPRSFIQRPIAHRALHDVANGRPENSRGAIKAAIDAGYAIEIDLQLSRDGAAMVFHDDQLERLTGISGRVRKLDESALRATPLLGAQEGIPNLDEILQLVAGQVPLVIELKDQDGAMGEDVGVLEQATARALEGYVGDVAVMSFNPYSVEKMQDFAPHIARGLTTSAYRLEEWSIPAARCDELREIPDYDRVGATFISHEVDDLDRPRLADLKAAGAVVCCWTVRSAAEEAQARKVADTITFEQYLATFGA